MTRGQMIPKGDNKWLLRVYLGRDESGKRKYSSKQIAGTTSQAQKELTKMVSQLDTGTFVAPSKLTVKAYLMEWLDSKANVAPKTLDDYKTLMQRNVYPTIGFVKLTNLSAGHIRALYTKLREDKRALSPRYIRYTHTVLSQGLSLAVEDGKLQRNPCQLQSVLEALPKSVETPTVILSAGQMSSLLAKTTDPMRHAMWRLALSAGMRPQEYLALTWSDIEQKDGLTWVAVRRAMHRQTKGMWTVSDETKTKGSKRSLVLDQDCADALNRHRAIQAQYILKQGKKYQRQGIVFASERGTHLDISNVRRWWAQDCLTAGLPEVRLYTTRHTFGSHHLDITGNAKATAEALGHNDPATTLRKYVHTLDGTQQAAVLELSKRMRVQA